MLVVRLWVGGGRVGDGVGCSGVGGGGCRMVGGFGQGSGGGGGLVVLVVVVVVVVWPCVGVGGVGGRSLEGVGVGGERGRATFCESLLDSVGRSLAGGVLALRGTCGGEVGVGMARETFWRLGGLVMPFWRFGCDGLVGEVLL